MSVIIKHSNPTISPCVPFPNRPYFRLSGVATARLSVDPSMDTKAVLPCSLHSDGHNADRDDHALRESDKQAAQDIGERTIPSASVFKIK